MPHQPDCIFCKIVKGEAPSWKVMENDTTYAFLDINPATPYHTLIIPKNHYENIFDVPEAELRDVIAMTREVAKLYERKLGLQHCQVINSNGAEGQQDVFHLHYHLVPRKRGDGQNIRWKVHPEWRSDFDNMLQRIHD
ncbi:MAG: HIT domain-containing protein [Bacteroidota bacterium]